jgi:hypothetical protein
MNNPTISRLRHDIDSGRTGDKIPVVDPAAAPLGTDEEAAGTPVPPEAVAQAHRYETSGPKSTGLGNPKPASVAVRAIGFAAAAVAAAVVLIGGALMLIGE